MYKLEDIQNYGKEQYEQAVSCASGLQSGVNAIAAAYGDYAKKSYEDGKSFAEKLSGVKSLEKALEAQSEYAKTAYETFVADSQKIASLYGDLAKQALKPLEVAAALRPSDVRVAIALGWCYKRTHRLAQAIDALQRAERDNPDDDLLHYNLACYWSLAGNASKALDCLAMALELNAELRNLIPDEPDFDKLRGNPEFERLTLGSTPQT